MLERICKANKLMDKACQTLGRDINVMEVCGTHTVSIFRSGIRSTLPKHLKLLSGPGCPVCVTDQGYIDLAIELAQRDDCILATYGDMIRVPGSDGSLETKNKNNVKVVLSAEDAIDLAKENPGKTVVFIAVGFETTTPATAVVVKEAAQAGLENFCVLCAHKLVLPAMEVLLSEKNDKIDAFLCPGHVSVIIGSKAYEPIAAKYRKPCVVAGFEPMQIIEGLAEICRQICEGQAEVNSIYDVAVTPQGNTIAQRIISDCFEVTDGWWRGIGKIPQSTLKLKSQYSKFDAYERFGLTEKPAEDKTGCRCGEVLCGLIEPFDCAMFGNKCTPQTPIGPCMVSSEGACAAWYKYGRKRKTS
ncbi:MAG: hydrogenase formation protein HypD [Phycisphaerae bacterium]|nr:hydrogenase formation protein HypD [Phycisphaerae bacterium]